MNEQVYLVLDQVTDMIHARLNASLDAFVQFKYTFSRQVSDHLTSAMSTQYVPVPDEDTKSRSLVLSLRTLEGKEVHLVWVREWKWP